MSAAFVCASLGITPTVRHADYIGSWLAVLREDDHAIIRAASAASKAADYLLAFQPGSIERVDADVTARRLRGRPNSDGHRSAGGVMAPVFGQSRLCASAARRIRGLKE